MPTPTTNKDHTMTTNERDFTVEKGDVFYLDEDKVTVADLASDYSDEDEPAWVYDGDEEYDILLEHEDGTKQPYNIAWLIDLG